eukprot:304-Prymnesium_polylepis.1
MSQRVREVARMVPDAWQSTWVDDSPSTAPTQKQKSMSAKSTRSLERLERLEARDELKTGNKAWLRRRLCMVQLLGCILRRLMAE